MMREDIDLNGTTPTAAAGDKDVEPSCFPSAQEISGRKLPSSRYKGVVPQPNGRWGAQIYEKHHRVWLGTFNGEADAARAYDVAARRFRGRDAVVNFAPPAPDAAELRFLVSHSKAEVVDMLRRHTYSDELEQSRRALPGSVRPTDAGDVVSPPFGASRELLFEKAVTPSDVGKLNRLVIPKQHAERHFPLKTTDATANKGVLLTLEDAGGGKVWRFRYSYWNSSQSYVLTRGWSRFVREKSLSAGDVVCFLRSLGPDGRLFIDWKPPANRSSAAASELHQFQFYQYMVHPMAARPSCDVVRLFGVNITKDADVGGGGGWDEESRRS